MASKSLGTLTIDLIAKVGGFVSGMDSAQRASSEWAKQVQKDVAASAAGLLSAGAAVQALAITAGTAGFALLKSTSEQINATDQWAKSLKMSTQDLLAWQFAAEKAGVAGDNMADIFKDLSDKIGDAVLNKSGDAVDALNSLGLSADKLSKVTPDKQMLAIGDALGKIGTNAGKITILESLGNDLSKLLPLFDNNNAKLTQFLQLAKDYGVAPDPQSIDDLIKVNNLFQDMEAQVKGLKVEIAAGLAHVDLSPLNNSLSNIHDVLTDPQVLQGIANLVSEVAQLAGWLIKAAGATGRIAISSNNRMAALGNRVDMDNPDQIQERIDYLNNSIKGRGDGMYDGSQTFLGWMLGKNDSVKAVSEEISGLTGRLAELNSQHKNLNIPTTVTPDSASSLLGFSLSPGESNGKPPKPNKDTYAVKMESAFRATEQGYLKQIALTDKLNGKNKEATEIEKLRFDISTGKLTGINKAQQDRLEGLATEIDKLTVLKNFSDMEDELLTPEEKLLEVTKERVKLLRQAKELGIANPEQYKKAAQAISKNAFTEAPRFGGIDSEYGGQQGELRKVDDAQKELEKWYQTQMDMLAKNRESQADLNDEWNSRELEIKKKHQDELNSLDNARSQLMLSSVADGLGSMVDLTKTAFGEQSGVYKAAFIAQKAVAIAQAMMAIETGVAMAAANPFPYNLAAMASVAAATAGIVSNIAAIGMAHDGIDSVPETGTWLLQKGERVTTAQTSAKLDATLDRVNKDSSSSGGAIYSPTIPITINGNPSDSTIELVRKAADEGAKRGYAMAVNSIASGQGNLHKALTAKTNAGRKVK